jgi:hypothetical protein
MVDKVLQSYKRWITQIAREFNVKDDEIDAIIRTHLDLTTT